jgi:hypothetical protein
VSIEDGVDRPIKLVRVILTIREFSCSCETDDQGMFVISLPADAKPGQEVVFMHSKNNYEIFFPYRGALRLPAPGSPPPVIEIHMLPRDSMRWWTDEQIETHFKLERTRSIDRAPGEAAPR